VEKLRLLNAKYTDNQSSIGMTEQLTIQSSTPKLSHIDPAIVIVEPCCTEYNYNKYLQWRPLC